MVDHDSRRLVRAAPGRNKATLHRFFDALGEARCAAITHVSADAADWIAAVVAERCLTAVRWADAYHVVAWATDALDEVRLPAGMEHRPRSGHQPPGRPGDRDLPSAQARPLRAVEEPRQPHEWQTEKLAWIAKTDPRLHRAYLLKEGLRHVFAVKGDEGKEALDRWLSWARRCRIPAFDDLARKIIKHRPAIDAALEHGLSNALVENTNTKIRLLTRVAFGFKPPEALIASRCSRSAVTPRAVRPSRHLLTPRSSQERQFSGVRPAPAQRAGVLMAGGCS